MSTKFTPTEERILHVLADGLPHTKAELLAVLEDDQASPRGMTVHITRIRKKLLPRGEHIVNEYSYGRWLYRHVRLLAGVR